MSTTTTHAIGAGAAGANAGATLTAQRVLAEAVESAKVLTARYVAGFTEASAVVQAPGLPNHVVWSLGHCALTMHRVAEKLDGRPMPEGEIAAGAASPMEPGSRRAFAAESVAFGSAPSGDARLYPTLARAIEVYNGACDRLAAALRGASAAQLEQTVPWGSATTTLHLLAMRMMFHNGFHTGQIADLRRAMGMKSVFG